MIERLKNEEPAIAKEMQAVFMASYAVEAALLNATDFPPLKRPLESYVTSDTRFFGYWIDQRIAGIIEVETAPDTTSINSLVVDPEFFRRGIGRALLEYVFNTFDSRLFVVETGLQNTPASELYKKFGFKEVKQWNTDHGVRKVKFERITGG